MLITFSGLDGAGKSTLIGELNTALQKQNRKVTVLTMYDHVGLYAIGRFVRDRIRRIISQTVGFHENAHPARKSSRQHRGLVTLAVETARSSRVKRFVYIIDLCILFVCRFYVEKISGRILVIDRYFYDSLADVADDRRWLYIRLFMRFVPVPDLAIFVDVSAEQAFQRKREYSVESLERRRCVYQKLFEWVPQAVVIVNEDRNVSVAMLRTILERIFLHNEHK